MCNVLERFLSQGAQVGQSKGDAAADMYMHIPFTPSWHSTTHRATN